ncbi:MAG: carbonic anhydrase [Planctomycetota bacterium]
MCRGLVLAILTAAAAAQHHADAQDPHPKRPAPVPVHAPHPDLEPRAALARLRAGHERFLAARAAGDEVPAPLPRPAGAGRFVVAVLGCADAAIDVPARFGLQARDVLWIATAGAEVDAGATALVEWAVAHERLSLVVVLTHERCASLTAGSAGAAGPDRPTPVPGAEARGAAARQLAARRRLDLAQAQALLQCERLLGGSALLRQQSAAGRVQLVPASVGPDGAVRWHTTRADELPISPVR